MFSQKAYALHLRTFWIIDPNDSQIRLKHFSINGGFSKIRKKSEKIHMYSENLTNQIWQKLRYRFFAEQLFFTYLLRTFGNYYYLESMFSAPSEWLIFFRFLFHQEVYKILSESHC